MVIDERICMFFVHPRQKCTKFETYREIYMYVDLRILRISTERKSLLSADSNGAWLCVCDYESTRRRRIKI